MRFKSVLKGSWYYSVKVSQRVCHWHRLIKAEEMRATGLLWEIKTSITCVLFLQFCESISEILSKFHKTFKKRTNKVGSTHLEWLSRNRSQSCVVVFLAEFRDKIMHFVEINKISSTYETFSFLRYNAIFFTKYQKS